jgi:hypothetical protein
MWPRIMWNDAQEAIEEVDKEEEFTNAAEMDVVEEEDQEVAMVAEVVVNGIALLVMGQHLVVLIYWIPQENSLELNGIKLVRLDEHSSAENDRELMAEDKVDSEELALDETTEREEESSMKG